MPKITTHGGPSNRHAPQPPQPRPGEGVFFQPAVAAEAVDEVPRTDGPETLTGDGTGEALPELEPTDSSPADEADAPTADEAATSDDAAAQADKAADTDSQPAEQSETPAKQRARKRAPAPVEGS